MKGTLSNVMLEGFKDRDLKEGYRRKMGMKIVCCKCCQIAIGNASKSMLPRHKDSDRHKSSSTKFYSLAHFGTYFH